MSELLWEKERRCFYFEPRMNANKKELAFIRVDSRFQKTSRPFSRHVLSSQPDNYPRGVRDKIACMAKALALRSRRLNHAEQTHLSASHTARACKVCGPRSHFSDELRKMKRLRTPLFFVCCMSTALLAQTSPQNHPDASQAGWGELFKTDLSNAVKPANVWSMENGVLTATEDQCIWSAKQYDNFVLELEFKTAPGTNSGVIIHTSDIDNWIPNSVEVQIADDYHEQWAKAPATWQCGAIFGHLPARKRMVKKAGEWNHYTITCVDKKITVVLNGELITEMDMSRWTSAKTNPDGSEIPSWLSKPVAELPLRGHIGFQGKHAGAPIWFRNIRIKELPSMPAK